MMQAISETYHRTERLKPFRRLSWPLWPLLMFLAAACGQEEQPYAVPAATITAENPAAVIVAVGDSLTEGIGVAETDTYPARLERMLRADGRRFRVVNAGVSGETSTGTLARIEWILSLDPQVVILETGANDGLRGLPPEQLARNLDEILRLLEERGVTVVLAGMRMLPNLGPAYTEAFAAVYRDAADNHDVVFMPFFLEGVAMRRRLNQPDGLHPNGKGYEVIAENLYPYVLEAVHLAAENDH
jgi:acyl-CoA thioesterase-1